MTSDLPPLADPYDVTPPYWRRHPHRVGAIAVFVLTVLFTVVMFPPFEAPEVAYAFAVPAIFWAYLEPRFKLYAWTVLGAQAVAWTLLLSWLHHVTWAGLFLLGPFIGAWVGLWFLLVGWAIPKIRVRQPVFRVIAVLGLAAAWVVIEWTRTWFLSGFPWLPLSASQWQRQILLQIAAYTGAAGISFILISFNLGFAAFAHRGLVQKLRGLQRRSPEFNVALLMLFFVIFIFVSEVRWQQREPLTQVAVVQPHIPQTLKWDDAYERRIYETLGELTIKAAASRPNVVIWPEAALPGAVRGHPPTQQWTEELVARAQVPLLAGTVVQEPENGRTEYYNGAVVLDPMLGLQSGWYAKQKLVPFGEFVPLRPLLGWLQKVVPVGDSDFRPGKSTEPLVVTTATGATIFGPLICYEDIFPQLARKSTLAGAEALVVMTNNGWFGEGGAAYQHAAHSVLRAVETRRPVIRCGNSGWSGWIDEFGNLRGVMKNNDGSVYFRGVQSFAVTRDARWVGQQSYYVKHGDWFILVCVGLMTLGWAAVRFGPLIEAPEALR